MIQVLGQSGMLGSAVVREAARRSIRVSPNQFNLELAAPNLIDNACDVVINCAGLVKQRVARNSQFMLVNAVGPHRVAEACSIRGKRLIHVSTDCVFGTGMHQDEYSLYWEEDSLTFPNDIYSMTKLAGEVYEPHLTIRTSFVGFGRTGLIHTLQNNKEVSASHNFFWSGHTVDWIAKILLNLAERLDITGLLHIPGTNQSRFQLATQLKDRWNLPAQIIEDRSYYCDRRLSSGRWESLELPYVPSFEEQLGHMERPND